MVLYFSIVLLQRDTIVTRIFRNYSLVQCTSDSTIVLLQKINSVSIVGYSALQNILEILQYLKFFYRTLNYYSISIGTYQRCTVDTIVWYSKLQKNVEFYSNTVEHYRFTTVNRCTLDSTIVLLQKISKFLQFTIVHYSILQISYSLLQNFSLREETTIRNTIKHELEIEIDICP